MNRAAVNLKLEWHDDVIKDTAVRALLSWLACTIHHAPSTVMLACTLTPASKPAHHPGRRRREAPRTARGVDMFVRMLTCSQAALALDPSSAKARFRQATAHDAKQQFPEALALLEGSTDSASMKLLGRVQVHAGPGQLPRSWPRRLPRLPRPPHRTAQHHRRWCPPPDTWRCRARYPSWPV